MPPQLLPWGALHFMPSSCLNSSYKMNLHRIIVSFLCHIEYLHTDFYIIWSSIILFILFFILRIIWSFLQFCLMNLHQKKWYRIIFLNPLYPFPISLFWNEMKFGKSHLKQGIFFCQWIVHIIIAVDIIIIIIII